MTVSVAPEPYATDASARVKLAGQVGPRGRDDSRWPPARASSLTSVLDLRSRHEPGTARLPTRTLKPPSSATCSVPEAAAASTLRSPVIRGVSARKVALANSRTRRQRVAGAETAFETFLKRPWMSLAAYSM